MLQFVEAPFRGFPIRTFDRRHIFEKFLGVQVGVHAKVLWQVTEHLTELVRMPGNVQAIPGNLAFDPSVMATRMCISADLPAPFGPSRPSTPVCNTKEKPRNPKSRGDIVCQRCR